ncbi:Ent-kaurene oxidase [Termitomyces sp. T112]|nr:Ent-kaurene oxidase [Termitomyces sp. T112]
MSWTPTIPEFLVVTLAIAIALHVLVRLIETWQVWPSGPNSVPAIGPTSPILSYIGAFRLMFDSSRTIQEGYDKYDGLFRIADFRSWTVIVSGAQLIEDVRKAPEDVLTFEAAIDEAIHALAPKTRRSHFHIPIIQTQLTRELTNSFDAIRDEVGTAFFEVAPLTDEWSRCPALDTTLEVVARTTHRTFVGLPLCRDPDYISMCKDFAMNISKAAWVIRLFSPRLKPLVGRPFVNVPAALESCIAHLRPEVEKRRENMKLYGKDYEGKPQDILSWFMDDVDGDTDEEKLRHVAFHLMIINFGAVYTVATSFTQALYHLAAHPECIEPLREEIERVTTDEGWTRAAMGELRKLDSFLKESQRISGLGAISSYRRVLKPFTFSNGMTIPAGMTIGVAAWSTHLDEAVYPNAHAFDGFRYVMDNEENGQAQIQMVTSSPNFLAFGLGRHMCPGRFFTVIVLKAMMIHILMNYDLKLENEGERPKDHWFVTENIPDSTASVLLRRRA